MKPLPKIARCKCRGMPVLNTSGNRNKVICVTKKDGVCEYCWIGPVRYSPRGAINAWNNVMAAPVEGKYVYRDAHIV